MTNILSSYIIFKIFLKIFLYLIFLGVRGIGYQGDIAIDDISFTPDCITNGSRPVFPTQPPICGTAQFTCTGSQICIPIGKKCDKVKDCSDGSDEDQNICTGMYHVIFLRKTPRLISHLVSPRNSEDCVSRVLCFIVGSCNYLFSLPMNGYI